VGELKEELGIFWQKSRLKFGWNGAHNSFPHITLTSSFKCPDTEVETLHQIISRVCDAFREEEILRGETRSLRLERYMSPNFFGLFVEKEKEALLRRLSSELCQEIRSSLGLKPEPILKSFHLTLAYQFQQKHFAGTGIVDLSSSHSIADFLLLYFHSLVIV
jgi:ubiquitin-associated SH3 domain-containing protein